uniref:Candidate secreted effector n=1 Tax=Meloidogyne incognita TaxID=6306 RepID=A0A914KLJ3_MELIC
MRSDSCTSLPFGTLFAGTADTIVNILDYVGTGSWITSGCCSHVPLVPLSFEEIVGTEVGVDGDIGINDITSEPATGGGVVGGVGLGTEDFLPPTSAILPNPLPFFDVFVALVVFPGVGLSGDG